MVAFAAIENLASVLAMGFSPLSRAAGSLYRDVTTGHYSMLEDSQSFHRGSMLRHCDVTAGLLSQPVMLSNLDGFWP